ncbi:helix-turn-helix domain-containing protein [Methylobacterium sp. J-068]|uniref:helix-turn-helix domain-containing protein n=1 Tax=Methylobacterium sp. J-068 TaxID=2836649 RepID=UPI001FB986C1|nr:helix-turn-helix domain-containing protein [Methylobacterium sp. J-068]MCJ2036776.1 helix-turn-helix domain-containing protein [Methylobacterium sp. J-068]
MFASSALVTPLAAPFHVEITSFWSEHMRFHFMEGVPFVFHRPAQKIGYDGIDAIVVQHVETGAIVGDFDGIEVRAEAGSLYIIDFSRPAIIRDTVEIPSQKRNFVGLPRAFAKRWFGALDRLHGFVVPPEIAETYTGHLLRLRARLPQRSALDAATLATTATLLAQAITQATGHGTSRSDPARLFQKARLYIESSLSDPDLGAAEIARNIGASRTRLFAVFQGVGGVDRYIRSARLEAVKAALGAPAQAEPIAVLAETFGFRSAGQLSRLFRQHFGVTPSQFSAGADPGGVRRHAESG